MMMKIKMKYRSKLDLEWRGESDAGTHDLTEDKNIYDFVVLGLCPPMLMEPMMTQENS